MQSTSVLDGRAQAAGKLIFQMSRENDLRSESFDIFSATKGN
jgi:hypothetical protein